MTNNHWILVLILAFGIGLRLVSFSFNSFEHGNVLENIRAALSVAKENSLKIEGPSPDPYWYSTAAYGGKYLDLNAPLWSVTNGAILKAFDSPDERLGFFVFRAASLLFGILVIFLSYAVGKRAADENVGIAAAGFVSFSYFMAEFSGNGHFYMAQAALYLLWALAALGAHRFRVPILGALSGFAWLLNYQAVVMIASTIALLFLEHGPWRMKLRNAVLALVCFVIVVSPLLFRNWAVFGNPLHTTQINMTYVWSKAGLNPVTNGDVKRYEIEAAEYIAVIKGSLTEWLPQNAYYAARKLFILLPAVFIFFAYGAIDLLSPVDRKRRMISLFILIGFHLLQASSWPIFQFRYFVPIFPLIAVAGFGYLFLVFSSAYVRRGIVTLSFAGLVGVNILMFYSNPFHVCYYDCAVTTGPFGRNEELQHLKSSGLIR